jgi:hypothetical protein
MANEQLPKDFVVYTVRRTGVAPPPAPPPPGDAVRIAADQYGNVIFRKDTVAPDKVESGLNNCFALARRLIDRAAAIAGGYQVESITMKLELDAEVGLVFVGDASVQAGIEVEIKRVDARPDHAPK